MRASRSPRRSASSICPDEAQDAPGALRVADQRLYAQKHARGAERASPHEALLQALFEREPELRSHVEGVAELSLAVGERLGLKPLELERLRLAAELHDVGKLAIPDTILRKQGPLDAGEWEFIRRHTVIGQRILDAAPTLNEVGKIVRSTHEHWDGTGYVDGLTAEEIPLAARVIAVCDAYVAMTSDRPYRSAVSSAEAVDELRRCSGSQYDPEIVELFCAILAARLRRRPPDTLTRPTTTRFGQDRSACADLSPTASSSTTTRSRVDVDAVHRFLSEESYWARGRPRETVELLVREATRVVGLYGPGRAAGRLRAGDLGRRRRRLPRRRLRAARAPWTRARQRARPRDRRATARSPTSGGSSTPTTLTSCTHASDSARRRRS